MTKSKSDSSEVLTKKTATSRFSYKSIDSYVQCSVCKNRVLKYFCSFKVPVLTRVEMEIMNHEELQIVCPNCRDKE